MRTVLVRPQAEADIDAVAQFYVSAKNVELGLRFCDAVARTFEALLEQPHLGSVQPWVSERLRDCRRWPVARPFEVHQVFYIVSDAHIEVVRVLHGARDVPSILA